MVKRRDQTDIERNQRIADFAGAATDDATLEGLLLLNTGECEPWQFHNRNTLWFNTDKDKTLLANIAAVGQMQPGLVRENHGPTGKRYQIIFGVRRWNACCAAGIEYSARVLPAETSDAHCALLMEIENEDSENITEFEKALSYARMVNEDVFESQKQLADDLSVSKQYVSKLIGAAALFQTDWLAEIFKPFVLTVSVANANKLLNVMKDPRAASRVREYAKTIVVAEEKDAGGVFKALFARAEQNKKPVKQVIAKAGKKVLVTSLRDPRGNVKIEINKEGLSESNLENVTARVMSLLNDLKMK